MKNLKMINEARRFTVDLLKQAAENEPEVTAILQIIASQVSAEIVGLENKFKSKTSLMRKLLLHAHKDKTDKSFEQKLRKFASQNNDSLRYTFIFPIEKYTEGFQDAVKNLKDHSLIIQQNRIWNAWNNTQTAKDTGYRGVNITVISSQNQIFELQFHTAESFRLKTETHHFYEELRDLQTSDERRKEIISEMLKLAKEVRRPEGI